MSIKTSLSLFFLIGCTILGQSVGFAQTPSTGQAPSKVIDAIKSLVQDDFSAEKHPTRKLLRGDWKVGDGMAHVVQDDELYRKYKNHGPILTYDVPHQDVECVVEFKPGGCQRVVFTLDANDGGHAFRVILRDESQPKSACTIQTYTEKMANGKAKPIVLSRELPRLIDNQWNRIEAHVEGDKAVVRVNGQLFEVAHERINRAKKTAKIGFGFGEFAVRVFDVNQVNSSNE